MMRVVISILCAVILLGACNTTYNQKNYKKYTGISYQEYEARRKQHRLQQEQQQQAAQPVEYLYQRDIEEEDIDTSSEHDFSSQVYGGADEDVIESVNSSYGEAVVVMGTKKISLGKDANSKDMQLFNKALDTAYKSVFSRYRADGFTYAMSPAGTVNPLSVMEVQCKLSENYATAKGKSICDYFFTQIPTEYAKEKANAKN